MTRRSLIIVAAFALIFAVAVAAVVVYRYLLDSTPLLIVHLRCGENTGGKLSVETGGATQTFDAAEVCRTKTLSVGGYQQGATARLTFENRNGARSGDLTAKYGADIQSDPQGFHVIIVITNEPPSVSSEKL